MGIPAHAKMSINHMARVIFCEDVGADSTWPAARPRRLLANAIMVPKAHLGLWTRVLCANLECVYRILLVGYAGAMRMLKSTAAAECVKAPTEMKLTPASA